MDSTLQKWRPASLQHEQPSCNEPAIGSFVGQGPNRAGELADARAPRRIRARILHSYRRMTSFIERRSELAARYLELGMHLLLIAPGTKKPINKWRSGGDAYDPTSLPPELDARRAHLSDFRASNDPELVRAWLDAWPEAHLAVDGAASGMFLLDLDLDHSDRYGSYPKKWGRMIHAELVEALRYHHELDLPETLMDYSPRNGGEHLIFRAPEGAPPFQAINVARHVSGGFGGYDVKWNGYVLLPSGDDHRRWVDVEAAIAPLPPEFLQVIAHYRSRDEQHKRCLNVAPQPSCPREAPGQDFSEARELLWRLPAAEFADYESFLRVAGSYHRATGGVDLDVFLTWAATDARYKDHRENNERCFWRGFKSEQPNLAGLRRLVREYRGEVEVDVENPLDQLNRDWAVLPGQNQVSIVGWIEQPETGRRVLANYTPAQFSTLFANRSITVPGGRNVPLAKAWLGWAERRTLRGVVFDPSRERGEDYVNLWQGWGVAPQPGADWSRLRELIEDVLCDGDASAVGYVLRWCAWMVQNPASQAEVAIAFRGAKGTGKGTLGRALCELAKPHSFHAAGADALTGRFNAHLEDCVLLFVDEGFWAGDQKGEGRLKQLITEPSLAIERKFHDQRMAPNHLHVMIASNSDWVVPASSEERRFAVFNANDSRRTDQDFFAKLNRDLYERGGLGGFLSHLMDMNLGRWHPRRHVPHTHGLVEQKLASLPPVHRFWFDRLRSGELLIHRGEDAEPWPESAAISVMFNQCVSEAKLIDRGRPPTRQTFAKAINEMCPNVTQSRPSTSNGNRPRRYHFPSLDECRAAFEAWLGEKVDWTE